MFVRQENSCCCICQKIDNLFGVQSFSRASDFLFSIINRNFPSVTKIIQGVFDSMCQ